MKSVLTESIELEVRQAMFEKAKEEMMSQFQDLTVSHTAKIVVGTAKTVVGNPGWVSRNCDRQLKAGRPSTQTGGRCRALVMLREILWILWDVVTV